MGAGRALAHTPGRIKECVVDVFDLAPAELNIAREQPSRTASRRGYSILEVVPCLRGERVAARTDEAVGVKRGLTRDKFGHAYKVAADSQNPFDQRFRRMVPMLAESRRERVSLVSPGTCPNPAQGCLAVKGQNPPDDRSARMAM